MTAFETPDFGLILDGGGVYIFCRPHQRKNQKKSALNMAQKTYPPPTKNRAPPPSKISPKLGVSNAVKLAVINDYPLQFEKNPKGTPLVFVQEIQ